MNVEQIVNASARERAKERLLRLVERIANDRRELRKLAMELGYIEAPVRNQRVETYSLIDAL